VDINSLFKPFHKTDDRESRAANPYGNGLGLSISKQIAIALGGDITVKSQVGSGSTFSFNFPAELVKLTNTPAKVEFD
jgi:signal transduction histidine kinase